MEIKLPQWGMAMNEGTVVSWLVAEGDAVEAGQELVEVEAAKTTQTVATPVAGTVGPILVAEDETVAPKTVLCTIVTADEAGDGGGADEAPPASPEDEIPAQSEVPDEAPAAVDDDVAQRAIGDDAGSGAGSGDGRVQGGPEGRDGAERGSADDPPASPEDEIPAQSEVPDEAPAAVDDEVAQRAIGGHAGTGAATGTGRVQVAPRARKMAKDAGLDLARVSGSGPDGRIVVADVEAALGGGGAADDAAPAKESGPAGRVEVVPLARKMAKDAGLDLAEVTGTGRGGRILPADVQSALDARGGAAAAEAPADTSDEPQVGPDGATLPDAEPVPDPDVAAEALEQAPEAPETAAAPTKAAAPAKAGGAPKPKGSSRMRRVIAERMLDSLRTTAQFTITTTADVTDLVAYRSAIQGTRPSFTDFIVRACALALKEHPDVNVRFEDGAIVPVQGINVGMAVAVDGGLMVPVVKGADRLGLADLAERTRDLAGRARDGGLTMDDFEGGTFSVTSLGGQGIDSFTPILNPPESAILGVGRTKDVPTRYAEGLVWRQELTLSLTLDHRAVDGYPGALFLARVVELLAQPRALV